MQPVGDTIAMYIPKLDSFGDTALPLDMFRHKNRHYHPLIRSVDVEPLSERIRFRVLQAHCARKGKRHDFIIESTEGLKCLWCGIVKATPREEIRT